MTAAHAYSVAQVAQALGVDRHTVWDWIDANVDPTRRRSHITIGDTDVPAWRIGRSWRIAGGPFDAATGGDAVKAPSNEPTPPSSGRCADCSAGQHHGCVVWGGACGCGRSIDEVWPDVEAWARRMGQSASRRARRGVQRLRSPRPGPAPEQSLRGAATVI